MNITIGKQAKQKIELDLNILIRTRLLIQANSGGGKSITLRMLAEQAFGRIQIIIIDPAGEFPSLREKYDYVLVGEHGETEANIRTAGMLAERLLELRASAVCDLYSLKEQKHLWVKNFLEAVMNSNKKLWHPVLFIIDEAHKFCPEKGEGESIAKPSMLALCSDGRKYGFCAVLATQRLAKLDKSAAAELLNVLIGPTFIDVDLERAHKALGIIRHEWAEFDEQMKTVEPGNFWALGRAISKHRILIHIKMPTTTHPEPGSPKAAAEPPPAPEKIKALLPKLSDLPKEVERKAQTESDLRHEITDLKRQLSARPTVSVPETKIERIEIPVFRPGELDGLKEIASQIEFSFTEYHKATREIFTAIQQAQKITSRPAPLRPPILPVRQSPILALSSPSNAPQFDEDFQLAVGHKKILTACAQYPDGVVRKELTALTGYKRSTRDGYIKPLAKHGLVNVNGGKIFITQEGMNALGPEFEPLPVGDDLRSHWLGILPVGEKKILEFLTSAYPNDVDREVLSEVTNFKRSTRDGYLKKMVAKRIVEVIGPSRVRAASTLFG